jgi:hypothetical protein
MAGMSRESRFRWLGLLADMRSIDVRSDGVCTGMVH